MIFLSSLATILLLQSPSPQVSRYSEDLDPEIVLSTESAVLEGQPSADHSVKRYLLAAIDKKTGKVRYRVSHEEIRTGSNFNYFSTVNYLTPEGPVAVRIKETINNRANCHRGLCVLTEKLQFPVSAEIIDMIADQQEGAASWRFKLISPQGTIQYGLFGKNEAEILRESVRQEKARLTE